MRSQPAVEGPDLEHGRLPDTLGDSVAALMRRLEVVEEKLHMQLNPSSQYVGNNGKTHPMLLHTPEGGVWHGEDFMI